MSRVDEALRRAAGDTANQSAGPGDGSIRSVGVVDDVAELSKEPFPVEMGEHRRRLQESAMLSVGSADSTQPSQPAPAPTTDGALSALFQQVDTQLAGKTVIDQDTSPTSREQYRRLAAALHHLQELNKLKVVMVTSAAVGEGKTLTAANLALTLSESYKKNVLLIDADLRRPAVHKVFRMAHSSGLSEGLTAIDNAKLPVHRVSERLSILSAGRPTADPIARLTSERMRILLDEARGAFEWVIIDTPPVALLPDANLLSAMVDGAILVIRANGTSYQLVQRAISAVGRTKILGTVLNRASGVGLTGGDDYYDYYYSSYSYVSDSGKSGNGSS